MIRACLTRVILAEFEHTVMMEGNHYFPPDSLNVVYFEPTRSHSLRPWKGIATYYNVTMGDQRYHNAAWTYGHPSPPARRIKNDVAFWPWVLIEVDDREAAGEEERR
jgi:uncharacterized protein (DUF427 family)